MNPQTPPTGVPEAMAHMVEQQPEHRVVYADGDKLPGKVSINGPDELGAMQKHIGNFIKNLPATTRVVYTENEIDPRHRVNTYRMSYTQGGVSRFITLTLEEISS